jgi:hypothetical protein
VKFHGYAARSISDYNGGNGAECGNDITAEKNEFNGRSF